MFASTRDGGKLGPVLCLPASKAAYTQSVATLWTAPPSSALGLTPLQPMLSPLKACGYPQVQVRGGLRPGDASSQVTRPAARSIDTSAPPVPQASPGSFSDEGRRHITLLTRQQLEAFVRDGFLVLQPSVLGGDAFHERMWEAARNLYRHGEFGNNLLSDIPELDTILDAPEVAGALEGLLGDDYVLQAHRHCHIAMEKAGNQEFHKDGFHEFRHMSPTDVMVMYYPQEVSSSMGPTAVLPGSQYTREKPPCEQPHGVALSHGFVEQVLTSPRPGSCILMHFHLWHRATSRLATAERDRFMFKFQFRRTRAFFPVPHALSCAALDENPFLGPSCCVATSAEPAAQRLACAAVWASLSGVQLRTEDASCLKIQELRTASGAWPALDAVQTLLPAFARPTKTDEDVKALYEAAGALQVCSLPYGDLSSDTADEALVRIFGHRGSTLEVHPWDSEWRLEVLAALPTLLSVESVLSWLVPLISTAQCPRTQTRALMGLYASGVRCGAPLSATWRAAVASLPLEDALLQCTAYWGGWLTEVKNTPQPREWLVGRYTLAESLRCIGRFCAPAVAHKALQLIGATERADLCDGPNWRRRFTCFVERRRRCPATSRLSQF